MSESSDPRLEEALRGIERELAAQRAALVLLGLKQCSWCRMYLRFAEPGTLFDAGQQMVCYGCSYYWWSSVYPRLPVKDRSVLVRKLVHCLIYQHHTRVIKKTGKAVDNAPEGRRLVADCIQCGSGRDTAGSRCSRCNGPRHRLGVANGKAALGVCHDSIRSTTTSSRENSVYGFRVYCQLRGNRK